MTSVTGTAHACARAQSGGAATIQEEEELLAKTQTEAAVRKDMSIPGQDSEGSAEPPRDQSGEGISDGGDDKYLYMQRGFTSEIFKIEIRNIPKYISYSVRVYNTPYHNT